MKKILLSLGLLFALFTNANALSLNGIDHSKIDFSKIIELITTNDVRTFKSDDAKRNENLGKLKKLSQIPGIFNPLLLEGAHCTGGTSSTVTGDIVLDFTSNSTLSCDRGGIIWALVIGGGASGAAQFDGGGGGAGDFVERTAFYIPAGNYLITIGPGGVHSTSTSAAGVDGTSTTVGSILTALGGGGGGSAAGRSGASGGGAAGNGNTASGGSATGIAGHAGGNSVSTAAQFPAAGGGGCLSVGGNTVSGTVAGDGGLPCTSLITGVSIKYSCGAGGGSGQSLNAGTGGTGGCADGTGNGVGSGSATAGGANRGGGGGGGGGNASNPAADGSSGRFVARFPAQ